MECQGYKIEENIVFQDNKSTIILEKEGKTSSSKRTKHIKVRYFFIKDMMEQGEMEIKYCPTEQMWSNVLTKPLQGQQFWKIRVMLINCPVDYNKTDRQNP